MAPKLLIPANIRKLDDETLQIVWNDGTECTYGMRFLRGKCPCAECVDEITGKRIISVKNIPPQIRAVEARPVGRYAYQFVWSDGHDTGIYTYTYLRELCQEGE